MRSVNGCIMVHYCYVIRIDCFVDKMRGLRLAILALFSLLDLFSPSSPRFMDKVHACAGALVHHFMVGLARAFMSKNVFLII